MNISFLNNCCINNFDNIFTQSLIRFVINTFDFQRSEAKIWRILGLFNTKKYKTCFQKMVDRLQIQEKDMKIDGEQIYELIFLKEIQQSFGFQSQKRNRQLIEKQSKLKQKQDQLKQSKDIITKFTSEKQVLQTKIAKIEDQIKFLQQDLKIYNQLLEEIQKENKKYWHICKDLEEKLKISSETALVNSYDKFFQGEILQDIYEKKKQLVEMIQNNTKKKIKKTKYLYKMDLLSHINLHNYIDGYPNLLLLIQMENGHLLGGFSKGCLSQNKPYSYQFGFLFSITNNSFYPLACDQKARSLIYEEYFIIFGNSQLRIRTNNNEIFSNFGIFNNHYFYHNQENVNILLGMGKNVRTGPAKSYEIYQIQFDE